VNRRDMLTMLVGAAAMPSVSANRTHQQYGSMCSVGTISENRLSNTLKKCSAIILR